MQLLALNIFDRNLITIGVLALVFIALYLFNRYGKSESDRRSDRLQKQYAVLTADLLAEIPDEELAEAVVANVFAKMDARRPDLYRELPLQTPGRCAVTAAWLVDRELDASDFETMFASACGPLAELAADGLDRLNAPQAAAAIRAALVAETEESRAECHADYIEAREVEAVCRKMIDYIRDNADEFVDGEE
ncbi:MAG: hypothetical protein IIX68_01885 [Clostridia bacterium]|nr:hypothetical protein [Clostridia bacterium]